MTNNNIDLELLAGLNLDSSEAEILRAIKILEKRIRGNAKAKISLDTKINERAIRLTIDKLQEMLKKKDLKIETKTSIEAISKEADAMLDVMESARKAAQEKLAFAEANRKVRESADNTADAINRERNAMNNLDDIDYILDNINMTGQQGNSVFGQLGDTFHDAFSAYSLANLMERALDKIVEAGEEAVETVAELNKEATSLIMATGVDRNVVKQYMADYNALGQELGFITADISQAADSYLRQGHSVADTNELIKDSLILSKVSELETAESTKYLTSIMQAYKLEAQDVLSAVDKLSAVDLTAAVDAGGIAEAMSKTAVSAQLAGVSIDELIAMVTTVGEVSQAGMSEVGNAIRTVFSRMQDVRDGNLSQIGDDGTIEDLSNIEGTLEAVGIKLRESNNEFRNMFTVLDETASKWSELSSVQKAAVSESYSGVRQKEKFSILMENWDKVKKYIEVSEQSSGTATEKFNSYLDSIEAYTNSLKASLENLASTTISDDLYISILDVGKGIVDVASETGILKGLLAGLGTTGGIYLFGHLATYMRDATREFANFGKALNITKNAVNNTNLQKLIDLTGGLSQSQTRALISTKNLTNSQKIAILMNKGLTQAEARQTIQTWGVATAQQGATASTISFGAALKGLFATIVANPMFLIGTAVTVAVTAVNKYKQAQEELVRETKQAAEKASELSTEITDLVNKYISLSEAVETDANAKEDLLTTQTELLKKLGLEGDSIDELITKYGNLSNAIKQASIDSLKSAQIDLIAGLDVVKEELIDVSKGGFINRNAITASGEDAIKAFGELEKAGLIGSNSYGSGSGYFTLFGDDNTVDGALENFNKLEEALKALRDSDAFTVEELAENPLYKKIYGRYSEMKDEVEAYQSAIDKINDNYAQILVLGKLQGGAVPKSEDELEKFKQELIDTAVVSKQFVGSQKDIEASVMNAVSAMAAFEEYSDSVDTNTGDTSAIPIFSLSENERKALDDYTEKLSLITKLRTEWADANASERMDLLSSISEQFSDFDLSGLESGKQTIEDALSDLGFSALNTVKGQISGYSDELGNMLAEAFGEVNITPYFEEVEKYQNLLSEVQSDKVYSESQIKAIIADNEDLADSIEVVEGGYKLEEDAVISLLNTSITAYNKQVSSAKITTQDIIETRQKLIESYGIEAELLKKISNLDLHGTSLEYLSDEDLKFDYGLTDEQIRAYREYSALVDSINLKHKELYETIETSGSGSGGGGKDFSDTINLIDRVITDAEHAISKLEAQLDKAPNLDEKLRISKDVINENKGYLEKLYKIEKFYQDKVKENFAKIPTDYQQAIKDGVLDIKTITNEQHYDAIQEYFDTVDEMYSIVDKITSVQSNVKNTIIQRLDDIVSEYDSITSITEAYKDLAQALLDFNELTVGIKESDYTDLIKRELELKSQLEAQFNRLNEELNLNKGSLSDTEIREREVELISLKTEIAECNNTLEEFKDSILELRWDNFEKGIKVLTDLDDELSTVLELIDDTDNFKDGNITEFGLTKLGLYAQQYVNAKKQVAEYGNAIEELEVMYRNGSYSVDEYNEKLSELNASQRESALAMNDAKKSFIDFHENVIQEQIDGMKDLVDAKKEALKAEQALHEYQMSISEKQDNIKALQRQIATLSLSDAREDRAKRLQLEQQLAKKQEELAEEQRKHSIEVKEKALDMELENYESEKNAELEELKNNLDSQDELIKGYLATVQGDYTVVYDNLQQISDEFGVTFTDSLISPWENATNAAQLYAQTVGQIMSQIDIDSSAVDIGGIANGGNGWIQRDNGKWQYKNSSGDYVMDDWVNDFGNRWYAFDGEGFMKENEWVDGNDGAEYYVGHNGAMCTGWNEIDGKHYYFDTNGKLMKDGYTPDGYVVDANGVWDGTPQMSIDDLKKQNVKIAHYTKGTLSVPASGYAIVDEYNKKELKIHADKDGKFQYFQYGSSILPADMSAKIIDMVKNYDIRKDMPILKKNLGTSMGNTYQPVTLQINSPLVHVEGGLDASMMGEMTRLMENRVPKIIEHSMINVMKTKGYK